MDLAHRVHTTASPSQVWEVLGDPSRWPEFYLLLSGVRGGHGRAAAGQHLLGIARLLSLRIPVDVLEADSEKRLVLLVHTAPGLREQVTYNVVPAVLGGCDITVSVMVEGPLARPAVLPYWLASWVTARVLGLRTDRLARGRSTAARRTA